MIKDFISNYKKKSLRERFLLFIGILFFLIYLTFGVIVIMWKNFPFRISSNYRIALGIVLIVYSFTRLLRVFNSNED